MAADVDPMAQLTADAYNWGDWAAERVDGQPEPPPGPLPSPWVAHPTEARVSAAWGSYAAGVVADPEHLLDADTWRWVVSIDGVDMDSGVADWLDEAIRGAVEALPPGVADG